MKNPPWSSLVLPLLFPLAVYAAEEPASLIEPDLVYVGSTPLERTNPDYPRRALSRGEEGWVQLSFIVTKEGDVSDLMIKDSSGNEDFERSALRALSSWKYSPAKVGDELVDSSETEAILRFEIEGISQGAGRLFVKEYRAINDLIAAGNLTDVEARLTALRFTEKHNLYEDAWFWWLDTTYAQAINDRKRMHESVLKALTPGDLYLPGDILVHALQLAYLLHVETFSFRDALDNLEKMQGSEVARKAENYEEVLAVLEPHAEKVRSVIDGPAMIVVEGAIRDDTYWFHTLSRNTFTLAEIQGKIASVEIRCNFSRVRRYDFVADVDWKIPASWNDCSVFLRGDVGTTFKVYELPQQETPVLE